MSHFVFLSRFALLLGVVTLPIAAAAQDAKIFAEVIYTYTDDSAAVFRQIEELYRAKPKYYARTADHLRDQYYFNRTMIFQLRFNESRSVFELRPQLRLDTENKYLYNLAVLHTQANRRYALNQATRDRRYERPTTAGDSLYHVIEPYVKYDWQLHDTTQAVAGYSCRKATYEYTFVDLDDVEKRVHVTAWYAPDLPYPYGPAGYDGLPGLILELTFVLNQARTYRATSVRIDQNSSERVPELGLADRVIER